MHEFTGERVIPGLVDSDLFNEHLARYRFAASFIKPGMKALDAGCGAGYGSAELANARFVAGVDISTEAAQHAVEHYRAANTAFAAASCTAFPFADSSFDLVAAFEVIEHLGDYRALLAETRRVLAPGGMLLVSTPNRAYYAESRGHAGPNPFHVHEFEYTEFAEALGVYFANVEIWTQNHTDTIVFAPASPDGGEAEAYGAGDPSTANFFVAACSDAPIARRPLFAWIPSAGNMLREREIHIAKLKSELASKDEWLRDALARHETLQKSHEESLAELQERNRWAANLNDEIAQRDARIGELQRELQERLAWVQDVQRQTAGLDAELAARTEWARSLEAELMKLEKQMEAMARSLWVRIGRKLRVGPKPDSNPLSR